MGKFCIHCGEEASQEHKVCIYCGKSLAKHEELTDGRSSTDEAPLIDNRQADEVGRMASDQRTISETRATNAAVDKTETKRPQQTKGNRWMKRLIGGAVVLLIVFIIWANNYASLESVEKRFHKALQDDNSSALQKLMIHHDGSLIEHFEAEAFLELYNERGHSVVDELTTIVDSGKFLFVFNTYKIEANDQIPYDETYEGLTYTFNDEILNVYNQDEKKIAFGPIAPGIYEVEASIDGEFGEFSTTEMVTLDNAAFQDYTYMALDFTFDQVTISVSNYDEFASSPEDITIRIEDHEFSLDENGETEEIGPLNINGGLTATVVTELPWGSFESEAYPLDSTHVDVRAEFYDEAILKTWRKTVEELGEQYAEAMATKSKDPLKNFSKQPKDLISEKFADYDAYSGKVMQISIDEENIQKGDSTWYDMNLPNDVDVDIPSIVMSVNYLFEEDFHNIADNPILVRRNHTWELGLTYEKKDDKYKWSATVLQPHDWYNSFSETNTWDGSKKLYSSSKKDVKKGKASKNKDIEKEIEIFLKDYTDKSVEAINERDFSIVSDYMTKNGPRYDEARNYIDYLESEGVYETWLGTELEKLKELDDNKWEVSVIEEFKIIWPDKTKVDKFRTKLIIKRVDGEFLVDELTETNSI